MNQKSFYANGKLMITGEYLVMEGAQALAIPLKFGQKMTVHSTPSNKLEIRWKTQVRGKKWFHAEFDSDLQITLTNSHDRAFFIQQILQKAQLLNPATLSNNLQWEVDCDLTFNPEWGFGSSSSLLSNLADWFEIDPYQLFWKIAIGSGYDIACARASKPIVYTLEKQKPMVQEISFAPVFSSNLHFVYSGKKQHTASSLTRYRMKIADHAKEADKITQITTKIIQAQSQVLFDELITEHENIIASVLEEKPIKERLFKDFPGAIKSLGAWGGDFMLVSSKLSKKEIQKYFNKKGLWPVFEFNEVML